LRSTKLKRTSIKINYTALSACFPERKMVTKSNFPLTFETVDSVMRSKKLTEEPSKKREPFSKEQLRSIFASIYCDPQTPEGLFRLGVVVFGVAFALRIGEMQKMEFNDLKISIIEEVRFLIYDPVQKSGKTYQGGLRMLVMTLNMQCQKNIQVIMCSSIIEDLIKISEMLFNL